jgi:hypothetical protein
MDIRYVVTSLTEGSPEHIYDTLYCARGQAENLIKRHKTQLASDRTSCRSANANQMRLILHTAAYWLMWRVQQPSPRPPLWPLPSSQPPAAAQGRRPRHRDRLAHPCRLRVSMPRRRRVQSHRHQSPASADIASAAVPHKARAIAHQPRKAIGFAAAKNAAETARPDHAATDTSNPARPSAAGS